MKRDDEKTGKRAMQNILARMKQEWKTYQSKCQIQNNISKIQGGKSAISSEDLYVLKRWNISETTQPTQASYLWIVDGCHCTDVYTMIMTT